MLLKFLHQLPRIRVHEPTPPAKAQRATALGVEGAVEGRFYSAAQARQEVVVDQLKYLLLFKVKHLHQAPPLLKARRVPGTIFRFYRDYRSFWHRPGSGLRAYIVPANQQIAIETMHIFDNM